MNKFEALFIEIAGCIIMDEREEKRGLTLMVRLVVLEEVERYVE
jgi:hypothetical protein